MKFVACDRESAGRGGYRKVDNFAFLQQFIDSALDCAKVDIPANRKPRSVYHSLQNSAKRFGFGVDVCLHNDEVYLLRRAAT